MGWVTPFSILRTLADSHDGNLSPAAAEAVLQLNFTELDQARMNELGDKCNFGTLTAEEAEEYEAFVVAADFLAVWQSNARQSLNRKPSSAA